MEDTLLMQVTSARSDEASFESLTKQHKSFILATAYRTANRYITESDDEWSIALIAFHEAVKSYDPERGEFRAYAAMVIRSRLLDYLTKEGRYRCEVMAEPEDLDGSPEPEDEISALQMELKKKNAEMSICAEIPGEDPLRNEVEALAQVMHTYEIHLSELPQSAPHAEKTRRACASVVNTILDHPMLLEKLRAKKSLPMKELCRISGVQRKVCERHRKYLITATEILAGDYPLLAEYLVYIRPKHEAFLLEM